MFHDSLKNYSFSQTLTQASISLILKAGKNLEECGSWRPISPLNGDIKLLAKVLACCLDPCLENIISEDQTGFIKGRKLSFDIR